LRRAFRKACRRSRLLTPPTNLRSGFSSVFLKPSTTLPPSPVLLECVNDGGMSHRSHAYVCGGHTQVERGRWKSVEGFKNTDENPRTQIVGGVKRRDLLQALRNARLNLALS